MALAEAQVDDAEIERALRHEFQPDYVTRASPSKQDLARRAQRVAKLMARWAPQLEDARACGRAKLQARLAEIAHRDGPGATQAATFLAREHTSVVALDHQVGRELKRLRSMSPPERVAEMERLAGSSGRPPRTDDDTRGVPGPSGRPVTRCRGQSGATG